MNILPFVIILLTILSISGYAFLNNSLMLSRLKTSICHEAERERIREANNSKERFRQKAKGETKYALKLNIKPLLMEGKENQKNLYLAFKRVLYVLYGDEELCDRIVEAILANSKNRRVEKLATIKLKDEELQTVFYRMVKGTKFSNFDEKKGVMPLSNYVSINTKRNKINLGRAPKELLLAFTDESTADEIIKRQKNLKELKIYSQYLSPTILEYFQVVEK